MLLLYQIIFYERIHKSVMIIDDKNRDEKLQYNINREVAIISALSSSKIDKYEYLTGEEILSSNQSQIMEQITFSYFPLVIAFEKATKTIEDRVEKQILNKDKKSLQDLFSKDFLATNVKGI